MAYPLIIIGAGASFDSINYGRFHPNRFDLEAYKPPLTDGLFDPARENIYKLLKRYEVIGSLASRVRSRLKSGRFTFEEILQDLLDKHNTSVAYRDEDVIGELISLNFFLADLFKEISNKFFDTDNNYKRLINEMRERNIKAYVVNFNYDLIFERSLGLDTEDVASYISGNKKGIKILKIHGACNWHFASLPVVLNRYPHAQDYFLEAADTLFNHPTLFSNEGIKADHIPANYLLDIEGNSQAFMPALALPLNKKSTHTCPSTHIADFDPEISKFDRVIIIGWRGTDSYLTKKLKEKFALNEQVPTFVVDHYDIIDKGEDEIKRKKDDIRQQYLAIPQLSISDKNIFLGGFSQLMDDIDQFSRLFDDQIVG